MNRRQALAFLGAGMGAAALSACGANTRSESPDSTATGAPGAETGSSTTAAGAAAATSGISPALFEGASSCKAAIEQSEGPYYIDVDKIRADVREDREGTKLRVAARVLDVDGCTPVPDAIFEIWHCDAEGLYSGFEAASLAANGGSRGRGSGGGGAMDAKRYLRGAQVTDANGIAVITTIYPGWYTGRSVHIHAKVALTNTELLATQFYFDDTLTDAVHKAAVYATKSGRRTRNAADGFFQPGTSLTVTEEGEGYLGLITIGVEA